MNHTNKDKLSIEELKNKTLKILDDLENGKISAKEASILATQLDSILKKSIDIKKNNQS